jgi:xanthine dehydrogenase YagT iron-sulfur-binding subunit
LELSASSISLNDAPGVNDGGERSITLALSVPESGKGAERLAERHIVAFRPLQAGWQRPSKRNGMLGRTHEHPLMIGSPPRSIFRRAPGHWHNLSAQSGCQRATFHVKRLHSAALPWNKHPAEAVLRSYRGRSFDAARYRRATLAEQKSREPDAPGLSRRSFLARTGTVGVVAALDARDLAAQSEPATAAGTSEPAGTVPISLRVNGSEHRLRIDPRTTLLDCLRENLALTGTKKGCDHGQCGACTVHVNDRRVNSCLSLAMMHDGEEITTIEGLGTPDQLHPMQAAFVAHDAYQCGYCTSGQIMSAAALLKEPCGPDDADVKELMSGNICRCGAYQNIVAAIQQVRRKA